jgi:hypothetical protein
MDNKEKISELDALKAAWNELAQSASIPDKQQILDIMKKKATNSILRLRRNLSIEIGITVLLFIGAYALTIVRGLHFSPLSWAFLLVLTFGYHVYLWLKLTLQPLPDETLVDSLRQQADRTGRLLGMYKAMSWFLALLVFGAIALNIEYPLDSVQGILRLAMALLAAIGAFALVRWFARVAYGQHHTDLLAAIRGLEG